MGKRKCSVKNCQSETDRPEDVGVTFHRIPLHPDIRPKWIELCKIEEDRKNYFVCSRHFLRADFCNFKGKKYMLRQGVLPSIFQWNNAQTPSKSLDTGCVPEKTPETECVEEESAQIKKTRKKKIVESTDNAETPVKPQPKTNKARNRRSGTKPVIKPEKTGEIEVKAKESEVNEEVQPSAESSVIEAETTQEDMELPPVLEKMDVSQPKLSKNVSETIPELELSTLDENVPNSKPSEPITNSEAQEIMPTEPSKDLLSSVIESEPGQLSQEFLNIDSMIEEKQSQVSSKSPKKLTFEPNSLIEVFDGAQTWSPATIMEVDYEENEVLVHFDNLKKCDEWIGINSANIRAPLTEEEKRQLEEEEKLRIAQEEEQRRLLAEEQEKLSAKPMTIFDTFVVTERCMAYWFDSNKKFPATVLEVHEDNTYTVKFDDGYIITVKADKMTKASVFASTNNKETKEDRRNKKRKLNVSALVKSQQLGGGGGSAKKKARTNSNKSLTRESPSKETLEDEMNASHISMNEDDMENAETMSSWLPSFVDGYPVGQKSCLPSLEGVRETYIVPDPRLPPNWEKHLSLRQNGRTWFTIIISPEGRKFRYRPEIQKYLADRPELHEYVFDFAIRKSSNRRRSHIGPLCKPEERSVKIEVDDEVSANDGTNSLVAPPKEIRSEPLLKIIQVADGFQCPIDGCGKCFRRENLAQMHVKHYHPQFTKFLDSSPNVLDLVYARLQKDNPENVSPSRCSTRHPQVSSMAGAHSTDADSELLMEKDLEIKKLLNTNPYDSPRSHDGNSKEEDQEMRLKDLLLNSEFKNNIVTTKSGLKTIPPVRQPKLEPIDHQYESSQQYADQLGPSYPQEPQYHIIEGGEVIRIVRMKQEEIINCTCGITEEDGLMIQCELCMCWQHAHCNNILRETDVPDKYICYICQNPVGQRSSAKYVHDQEWLKRGLLPTASYHWNDDEAAKRRTEKLRISRDISGGLMELKEFANTLRLKIKIAEVKNHPKLYLWSKPCDKPNLPEKRDIKKECDDKDDIKKEELPKLDLNALIENNLHDAANGNNNSAIPEPEDAIETEDCRLNLLEHIAHYQKLMEERLEYFEKQIGDLDATPIPNTDEDDANVRTTSSLLLKDLSSLKELSQIATF